MRHFARLLTLAANHREPATTLALFRILLCSCTLFSLWIMCDPDVFEVTWTRARDGGLLPLTSRHWLFRVMSGPTAHNVKVVFELCAWSTALALVGFGGRLTILVAQQCYVALRTLNENASGGYDTLICLGLLILACSGSTATLSLDCQLSTGRFWSARRVAAWPRAVLVFQVLWMYSLTGLQKVGYSWTPMGGYSALHYVLNDPTWLRWDLGRWPWALGPLLRIATAVSWHWEQFSLLLLLHWYYRFTEAAWPRWLRRLFRTWDLRYAWAAVGLVLHASILVLFDVGPFSLVTVAYYVNLWAPRDWHAAYSWASALVNGRRKSPPPDESLSLPSST